MEEQADEYFHIEFSEPFEADMDAVYLRLSRFSPEAAHRWQTGILAACLSLDQFPRRCPLAQDSQDFGREVRQLIYRNRHSVYQVLYTIFDATEDISASVRILRIRQGAHHEQTEETE